MESLQKALLTLTNDPIIVIVIAAVGAIVGAAGTIIVAVTTNLLSYLVVGKPGETHKTELSISAKRKDRYYDIQTEAVAGTYGRLVQSLHAVLRLGVPGRQAEKDQISNADKCLDDLIDFFSANAIYFPDDLVNQISEVKTTLLLVKATLSAATDSDKNRKPIDDIRKDSQKLLADLRSRFRQMMLEGEAKIEL